MTQNMTQNMTNNGKCMVTRINNVYQACEKYLKDSNYVYKRCGPRWIVVMKKTQNTITNENRQNVVDDKYAKFRANMLHVEDIFDIDDSSIRPESFVHQFKENFIFYHCGKIVCVDNYDTNIQNVCAPGIHYFKTPDAAIHYLFSHGIECYNFPGTYKYKWRDDGQTTGSIEISEVKCSSCKTQHSENMCLYKKITDGASDGSCIEKIYHNGLLMKTFEYEQNVKLKETYHGRRSNPEDSMSNNNSILHVTNYYMNGFKSNEGMYINWKKEGVWEKWYPDGKFKDSSLYINNKFMGLSVVWNENGMVCQMMNFCQNRTIGMSMFFEDGDDDNYLHKTIGQYVDDKPAGLWTTYKVVPDESTIHNMNNSIIMYQNEKCPCVSSSLYSGNHIKIKEEDL